MEPTPLEPSASPEWWGEAASGVYVDAVKFNCYSIQKHAESFGFGVVKELVGHGIGSKLHEDPQVPNFGFSNTGPKIEPGLCLAIEPMINLGTDEVFTKSDNWTVCTKDGNASAHFEHSIAVCEDEIRVLTK